MLEKSPKSKYSAVFSCIHSSNHSSITVLKQQKNPTRLAGSSFLVIFTAVPWLTNNKIQSHIPSYMLEKVQIGCPLHPHLSLSVMSLGFMLVYLPLTHLVLSQLGSKSCSYLLLTERLRASFFCLLLPWLLSLFGLGISQMLAVKTVHSLPLIFCPEQPFHQIFS